MFARDFYAKTGKYVNHSVIGEYGGENVNNNGKEVNSWLLNASQVV